MDYFKIYEGSQYKAIEKLFTSNRALLDTIPENKGLELRRLIERYVNVNHDETIERSYFIKRIMLEELEEIGLKEKIDEILKL